MASQKDDATLSMIIFNKGKILNIWEPLEVLILINHGLKCPRIPKLILNTRDKGNLTFLSESPVLSSWRI